MKDRRGTLRWGIGIGAAACATAAMAFGGSAALAAPGDAFYLSNKKKTSSASRFARTPTRSARSPTARKKLKCRKGTPTSGLATVYGSAPIEENLIGEQRLRVFWATGHPGYGGIAGTIARRRASRASCTSTDQPQERSRCDSGTRSGTRSPSRRPRGSRPARRANIPGRPPGADRRAIAPAPAQPALAVYRTPSCL